MKRHSMSAVRKVMLATAVAAAPALAFAGPGPYVGVEGGPNWVPSQTFGNIITLDKPRVGWAAGLVGGYQFENGFRPELELNWRRNNLTTGSFGGAGLNTPGSAQAYTAMGNLWYDFSLPASWNVPQIHPYLGGGIGWGRVNPARLTDVGGVKATQYRSAFMYQGGAGIDYDITQHLTASLGWRWIQSERKDFATGAAVSGVPAGATLDGRYRANTMMVGLRYSFGAEPVKAAPVPPPPPPPPVAKPACNPPAGFQVDANCNIIPQTIVLRSVNFLFNKATLTEAAKSTLDNVAAALKRQPDLDVRIEGFTDSIGSARYNLKLSQARADAVRNYLVSDGVSSSNLTAKGFGKTDYVATNATPEGRAQNRRVQFVVTNHVQHVDANSAGPTSSSVNQATESGNLAKRNNRLAH